MSSKLVPIAVSSQLDVSGEERIHAAPYGLVDKPLWSCTLPEVEGDLLTGLVGEDINFQYTLVQTEATQPVTVSVTSGSLPTGLSMDSSGLITGTIANSGAYTWEITPTSECGDGTPLVDDVTVPSPEFWMVVNSTTTAQQNRLWRSMDGFSYGVPTTRTPNILNPAAGGMGKPMYAGDGQMVVFSEAPENLSQVEVITDPSATPIVTTVASVGFSFQSGALKLHGDVLAAPENGERFWLYSLNKGVSWTRVAGPNADDIIGLARLANGRWLAVTGTTGPGRFFYSDAAIPQTVDWIDAGPSSGGSGGGSGLGGIVTDGSTAITFDNSNPIHVFETSTGTSWVETALAVQATPLRGGLGFNSTFLVGCTDGRFLRKVAGVWSLGFLNGTGSVVGRNIVALAMGEDRIVASCIDRTVWVSLNNGATWAQATIPFTPNFNDQIRVGVNWNSAL